MHIPYIMFDIIPTMANVNGQRRAVIVDNARADILDEHFDDVDAVVVSHCVDSDLRSCMIIW